jgi:type II secretory pathway pseudopilin PulG
LLVVIAIIGILMSLLLVSIGYVRGLARRTTCLNNMRELTKGVIMFETSKKRYPGYVERRPGPDSLLNTADDVNYSWITKILPYIDQEPVYDRWPPHPSAFIDPPGPIYAPPNQPQHFFPPAVTLFRCPDDTTMQTEPNKWLNTTTGGDVRSPWTSYVANAGFLPLPTDPQPLSFPSGGTFNYVNYRAWANRKANGVFQNLVANPMAKTALVDLKDGAGSTLMLSENLQAGYWHSVGSYVIESPLPLWDSQRRTRLDTTFVWLFAGDATQTDNLPSGASISPATPEIGVNGGVDFQVGNQRVTTSDFLYPCFAASARPSSQHGDVVVVSFADGRTQLLSQDINYYVYQSLMTPNNTKSDMPYRGFLLKSEDYNLD